MKAEEGSTEDKRREQKGSRCSFSGVACRPWVQPPDTSHAARERGQAHWPTSEDPPEAPPTAWQTHGHRTHGPLLSGSVSHRDRTGVPPKAECPPHEMGRPGHYHSERKWGVSRLLTPLAQKKCTFSKAHEGIWVFTAFSRKITESPAPVRASLPGPLPAAFPTWTGSELADVACVEQPRPPPPCRPRRQRVWAP